MQPISSILNASRALKNSQAFGRILEVRRLSERRRCSTEDNTLTGPYGAGGSVALAGA